MLGRITALFCRYKSVLLYLLFGFLTTLVNVVSYAACARWLNIPVVPSAVIAWVLAVLFAFVTNRLFVFKSGAHGAKLIARECGSFFAARFFTGMLDWLGMYVFVTRLCLNDVVIKLLLNVAVIILNYVLSRFFVFKK